VNNGPVSGDDRKQVSSRAFDLVLNNAPSRRSTNRGIVRWHEQTPYGILKLPGR
jgi:hypothetical protein